MERTIRFEVNDKHELYNYCVEMCGKAKNMYNVANYYIRNTATALTKETEGKSLTTNEIEVLQIVRDMIKLNNKTPNKKSKIVNGKKEIKEKVQLEIPTVDKKFLNYQQLNAIFSFSNNSDYRALPIHMAQRMVKVCCQMWKGYFASIKDFKKNPSKYKGMPKFPHYKENELTTTYFSNQNCIIKEENGNKYLKFPSTDCVYNLGKIDIEKEKLVKVEIKPFHNIFFLLVTVKDNNIPDKVIINKNDKNSNNIMGIDIGVNNFATITDNLGNCPIIIKGGFLKNRNQYFNKYKALITSNLQKGTEPTEKYKTDLKLEVLSINRDKFFRDCFFKISHKICAIAKERNVKQIVVGHIKFWKDEVHHGKENNQNFVAIPFSQFIHILMFVGLKYNINVIEYDESYTSQASFLDDDKIPTYKKSANKNYTFSGKRQKRGKYISKNGTLINADVNASLNIIKKAFKKCAFAPFTKVNCITSIQTLDYYDFYPTKKKIKINKNMQHLSKDVV